MANISTAAAGDHGLDDRSLELRRLIVRTMQSGGRGHLGSALSIVEILRVLYDDVLRLRPQEPNWADRDRCILSKGHGCLALYVMLAERGYFPHDVLASFCARDSILGGHPEWGRIPGVDATTGALGHGLSIGLGMALAARMQGRPSRIFTVLGDGEINEGSVWEAAMSASRHQLNNLIAIVDYNKMQSFGPVADVQPLEPLADKWRAFGFDVHEIDGHSVSGLRDLFRRLPATNEKPTAVICHTIKGKGVPSAEGNAEWHHKSKLKPAEAEEIRAALGGF